MDKTDTPTQELTSRQELYCQHRAAGLSQRQAYYRAYPSSRCWKDASVDREACVLEAKPKVAQRLAALLAESAKRAVLTRAELIGRIAEVNRIAYEELAEGGTAQNSVMGFTQTAKQLLEVALPDADDGPPALSADFAMLLPAAYVGAHRALVDHACTDYAFAGGRGSGKSSFIALEVVRLLLASPEHNAVVLRRIGATLRKTVYAQLLWAIGRLGLAEDFCCTVSPMEMAYRPTGQKIVFIGLDDREKAKSLAFAKGYAAIAWYEEFAQFEPDDVRSANQSLSRGGDAFWRLYSWNPPRSKASWVNDWAAAEGRWLHRSDYRDVPVEWLGAQFVADAEELREVNELAYRHEYLGENVGTDGEVFQNLVIGEVTDEEAAALGYLRWGVDWGYFPDPWVFGCVGYDAKAKVVYILDEAYGLRQSDEQAAARAIELMSEDVERNGRVSREFRARAKHNEVYCDSAEPKSVASWKELGINALPVRKFKGSVDAGIKWLQTRAAIRIDPRRAPLSAQEFTAYEYADDGQGGLKSYPDKDNHTIDKARYALAPLIMAAKEY
jgi:PBSX family phage terminase large subunit